MDNEKSHISQLFLKNVLKFHLKQLFVIHVLYSSILVNRNLKQESACRWLVNKPLTSNLYTIIHIDLTNPSCVYYIVHHDIIVYTYIKGKKIQISIKPTKWNKTHIVFIITKLHCLYKFFFFNKFQPLFIYL